MLRRSFVIQLFVIIGWGLCLPFIAYALEATALVDKNHITLEDSVFLRVEVNGTKGDADLSGIKDFRVMSRGSSSLTQMINGKTQRKITFQYLLIPLRKGELVIPAIPVTKDGQTVFTEPITIRVDEAEADTGQSKALFARAQVTPSTLVAGQQAVYSLLFYRSQQLARVGFETAPDFKGMAVKPFEKEKSFSRRINGVAYQVTQVDYLIVPQTAGSITIEPAILIAQVIVKNSRTSPFDSFFNDSFFSGRQTKPVRVTANPVTIDVSPLPEFIGDPPFSGLIGEFDIDTSVDRNTLSAGESVTLSIKISGSGNIMDAGAPEVVLPGDSFKVYEDNPKESIRLTVTGYKGYKEFKRAVVPVKAGRYIVPKVSLTYFDVNKKNYRIIQSEAIHLDVAPSQEIQEAAVPGNKPASIEKQDVSIENRDILDIKEGLYVLEDYRQISPIAFLICLVIPACLFGGVKLFVQAGQKEISPQKAMVQKAKDHLKKAGRIDPSDDTFWSHLYSAIVAMILSKTGKKGESVTLDEARAILEQEGLSQDELKEVLWVFETIESVRFSGLDKDAAPAGKVLEKIGRVIKMLCVIAVAMTIFATIPDNVGASPSENYVAAIKSYKQGDFLQAASKFEKVAHTPINNPHLFYNIGNAYLKARDIGRAILWYERARNLAPNDPDLKFNLAYAGTLVKDNKEESVNLMNVIFFWDELIRIKSLQITCISFCVLFFTWAAVRTVRRQTVFTGTGFFILALFVLITGVTGVSMMKKADRSHAVIVSEKADVRSGLAQSTTRLFVLHAGTKVRVQEKRDQHYKIVFSKDKVGWVRSDQAEII